MRLLAPTHKDPHRRLHSATTCFPGIYTLGADDVSEEQ